ncbi:DUF397 domain-containing protein [Actinoplanes sp. HUAS TT8]|uniref:DUF397 domain-containing protein n=1 Tax=Actinoplanes sp. HUAS TT8 TaxID=3447453 RepID=UPI003F5265C8
MTSSGIDLSAAVYRKSTRSGENNCVEVSTTFAAQDVIAVRDSKNPDLAPLLFNRTEWSTFLGAVQAGEFDL